jgi:hypothetical protein
MLKDFVLTLNKGSYSLLMNAIVGKTVQSVFTIQHSQQRNARYQIMPT